MANKVLTGVTLNWCKFNTPDEKYGNYGCQVILTPEMASKLESLGLKYTTDAEGNMIYKAKRGPDDGPVPVYDTDAITPITASVSNGATADIMLDVYQYKKFGGGIAARLKKVRLLNWEPYDEGETFEPIEDAPF